MTPRKLIGVIALGVMPFGALAGGERPAPDYYLDVLIATTTAQQLALSCPTLSVNLPAMAEASGAVINRLSEDGFDMTAEKTGMADASAAIAARQTAFVEKYGLDAPTEARVCAAGRAEIAAGTVMGSYLIEVADE